MKGGEKNKQEKEAATSLSLFLWDLTVSWHRGALLVGRLESALLKMKLVFNQNKLVVPSR